MAKKIIIGNWKMNPASAKEAELLLKKISGKLNLKKTEVVVCPPYLYLEKSKKISKAIKIGAQNISAEEKGAFTGEISVPMLKNLGVEYVIIGHSERRVMGETNFEINKKIKTALFFGLRPILCVGETERDETHRYFEVVKNQIKECLLGVGKDSVSKLVIAYEPVWALSTTKDRKDANPSDAREMAVFIKKVLADKFGVKTKMPRIIYGGSVNDKNCEDFLSNGGVDGAMPGAASLNPEKFLTIINAAEKIK